MFCTASHFGGNRVIKLLLVFIALFFSDFATNSRHGDIVTQMISGKNLQK